ncbi:YgaP family membrane protein [Marivivens marinus]|uniref:YgaP family membrane protein n=1 Tax=Marivivens marinus TaxID=3110173 RepID=UPI003B849BF1
MLKKNEGNIDRILRVVLGAALIAGYFMNSDGAYSWLYLLGIIPLVTGLIGSCPLYTVLGISTCPMKKG